MMGEEAEETMSAEDILTGAAESAASHVQKARDFIDAGEWSGAMAHALTGLLELGVGLLTADLQDS